MKNDSMIAREISKQEKKKKNVRSMKDLKHKWGENQEGRQMMQKIGERQDEYRREPTEEIETRWMSKRKRRREEENVGNGKWKMYIKDGGSKGHYAAEAVAIVVGVVGVDSTAAEITAPPPLTDEAARSEARFRTLSNFFLLRIALLESPYKIS